MPNIALFKLLSKSLRTLDAYLMGYDVFISYTWSDGRDYAQTLEKRLRKKHYRCFLDSSDYQVGDDLKRDASRAVKWSRAAVVVATKQALASKHVRKEINLFEAACKPIVPIDVDGALYEKMEMENGAVSYQRSTALQELLTEADEQGRQEIEQTFGFINRDVKLQIEEPRTNAPSEETIDRLSARFTFTRKVARRLRIIGATCLLLVTLAILALLARHEAEKQRDHAEKNLVEAIGVARTITDGIDRELEDVPGAETVRDDLLESAYELLERLLKRAPRHPELKEAQADTAQSFGSLHFRHRSLADAKEYFEKALALYEIEGGDEEKVIQCFLNLARTHRDLGNPDDAKQNYDKALQRSESFKPENKALGFKAQALYGLGDLSHDAADLEQALNIHLEAENIRRRLVESPPSPLSDEEQLEALLELATSTDRVGHIYDQSQNLEKAFEYHQESYRIASLLLTARPGNGQYRRDFALAASRLGYDFLRKNDSEKALFYYRQGESTLRDLVKLAPTSKRYRYNWAIALSDLGDVYTMIKQFAEAERYYLESLTELATVIRLDTENPTTLGQRMVTENSLAEMYAAAQDPLKAIEWYQSALKIAEEKIRRWPGVPNQHYAKSILLRNLGEVLYSIDQHESKRSFDLALQELSQLVETYGNDGRFQSDLNALKKQIHSQFQSSK